MPFVSYLNRAFCHGGFPGDAPGDQQWKVKQDSNAPSLTVIADQDGNKGTVCVDVSAAKKD